MSQEWIKSINKPIIDYYRFVEFVLKLSHTFFEQTTCMTQIGSELYVITVCFT